MDIKEHSLQLRLDSIRAAQERSRLALLAATVVSLAILTAGWNAYLSYYRQFALDQEHSLTVDDGSTVAAHEAKQDSPQKIVVNQLRRELFAKWVQSRMISIALLGIHVGVDDAPTVGAIAMCIVLYWLFLCMRREHYSIAHLLRNFQGAGLEERILVFYGVNSYTVFTNTHHSDTPIWKLNQKFTPSEFRHPRVPTLLMFWLPVISLVTLLVLDIFSLFVWSSPFRDDWHQSLYSVLVAEGEAGRDQLYSILRWDLLALLLLIPVTVLCFRVFRFANASESLLRDFWNAASKEAIQRSAFEKWEAAGSPSGADLRFWLEAEWQFSHGMMDL